MCHPGFFFQESLEIHKTMAFSSFCLEGSSRKQEKYGFMGFSGAWCLRQGVSRRWGVGQRLQSGMCQGAAGTSSLCRCRGPALPAHPFQAAFPGCICRKASTLPAGPDEALWRMAKLPGMAVVSKASSWAVCMKALVPSISDIFIIFLKLTVKTLGNGAGCAHGFSSNSPR